MTGAAVRTGWSLNGLDALVLRNRFLTVTVLPGLGGKVWQVLDHASGRELLWNNPAVRPRAVPFGAGYDDVFAGGWDELFPNDVPEVLAGEPYPDHGELWALPWEARVDDAGPDVAQVTLTVRTPVSGCRMTKTLALRAGERRLHVVQRLENPGRRDLPYLWKQHLALAVDGPARLDLPACRVVVGDFGSPRAGRPGDVFDWPVLEDDRGRHDFRRTPAPGSGTSEFLFGTGLADGWCSLTHADGVAVALRTDPAVFGDCWTFASYGGWRDLDVVVLEPCTGYPLSVADGVAAGTHRVLPAGAVVDTRLVLSVRDGLAGVTSVAPDGTVTGPARQEGP